MGKTPTRAKNYIATHKKKGGGGGGGVPKYIGGKESGIYTSNYPLR
jgi:hypothetical protein